MGNKSEKPKNTKRTKSKLDRNALEEDEEFFDDNMPKKKSKKNSESIGIDHNLLISQVKSDPFVDYTILKELGQGSFATVHLVKHNISGAIRAMK
jgi:serine/threonine protein kinase